MKKLIEYGENRVLHELIYDIFPYLKEYHDDAVIINTSGYKSLAFSTDPCPEPLVSYFDTENKYYHYGRLSVLINYSDLAASGVKPIGILLSTIMPNEMLDEQYRQFLRGVKEACDLWGGCLLGGNIKDGEKFSVTGTAIGAQVNDYTLKRNGTAVGDAVCVCGDLGMFWLAMLKLNDGSSLENLDDYTKSFVISPAPRVREGLLLSKVGYVSSCMDNSDGIIGCLYELANINGVSIMIHEKLLNPNPMLSEYCGLRKIDYRNLMLSWGGWDLVFTCPKDKVSELQNIFKKNNLGFSVIGEVVPRESSPVMICNNDDISVIRDFSSKRFSKNSYFSYGLNACISPLLENQINPIK